MTGPNAGSGRDPPLASVSRRSNEIMTALMALMARWLRWARWRGFVPASIHPAPAGKSGPFVHPDPATHALGSGNERPKEARTSDPVE